MGACHVMHEGWGQRRMLRDLMTGPSDHIGSERDAGYDGHNMRIPWMIPHAPHIGAESIMLQEGIEVRIPTREREQRLWKGPT